MESIRTQTLDALKHVQYTALDGLFPARSKRFLGGRKNQTPYVHESLFRFSSFTNIDSER